MPMRPALIPAETATEDFQWGKTEVGCNRFPRWFTIRNAKRTDAAMDVIEEPGSMEQPEAADRTFRSRECGTHEKMHIPPVDGILSCHQPLHWGSHSGKPFCVHGAQPPMPFGYTP
ncbi:hypothetical protein ACLKA6_009718 [Drosophila palustris]